MPDPVGRILVVDDEPLMRSLLHKALEGRGHKVDSVEDVPSAANQMKAAKYDLVITDYSMPRVTGLDLIQAHRGGGVKLPFILMTSYTPEEVLTPGGHLDGVEFLRKPFGLTELHSAVRKALLAPKS